MLLSLVSVSLFNVVSGALTTTDNITYITYIYHKGGSTYGRYGWLLRASSEGGVGGRVCMCVWGAGAGAVTREWMVLFTHSWDSG